MIAKIAYTIFIGILFAAVAILGTSTFYTAPAYPVYPSPPPPFPVVESVESYPVESNPQSINLPTDQVKEEIKEREDQAKKDQEEFDKRSKEFEKKNQSYNTNLSIMSLSFALLFMIAGILSLKKLTFLAEGLMVGGVIVLFFAFMNSAMMSIGSSSVNFSNYIKLGTILIGLLISLLLGYFKFLKPSK